MFVAISEYKRLNNENIKSGRFYAQSEKMDINTNGPNRAIYGYIYIQ